MTFMLNNNQDNLFWQFQPRESHLPFKSMKKNNYNYTSTTTGDNHNSTTIEMIDSQLFKQADSIEKEKEPATGVLTTRYEISKKAMIDDIYQQINQDIWVINPVIQLYKHLITISNQKSNPSRRRGKESKAEMPTIHIIADPFEIALLNENKLDQRKVNARMLYTSSTVIQEFNQVDFKIADRTTRTPQKLTYDIKIRNNKPSSISASSLHGFRRIKLCSFGYDLSRLTQKMKYRMVGSMKMPTSSFNYVKVYINNRPVGLFGLFGFQAALHIDNELLYGEKRQLQQQQNSVYKYQIKLPVVPILEKDDDIYVLNSRYNNTTENQKSHNLQQNSYKIMNKYFWPKSDIHPNEHSESDGSTGKQYLLPEPSFWLRMNNVLFKIIATNRIGFFNSMGKVVDDYPLEKIRSSFTIFSKSRNDISLVNQGITLKKLFSESTDYISLPNINECIK